MDTPTTLRIGAVVAAVAIAALALGNCYGSERQDWEDRIADVQLVVAQLRAQNEDLREQAAAHESITDSIVAVAEPLEQPLALQIDRVLPSLPPETRTLVLELQDQSARWQAAFRAERSRSQALLAAEATVRAAADSLQAALDARPGERPWWIPREGVGPYVGICTSGLPCAGVGATLSWEIKL